jgi:gamma-glutamyltranspeptidase/glutathione hydrolase
VADSESTTTADQTSQIVVVDAAGRIASTTTTINLNFGARLQVDGYVLNNALTNFSAAPPPGQTQANQMAPGKRPVTSMAPVVVFDAAGQPVVAGGSAGGGQIVDYIARALIEQLWLARTPAQALAGGQVTTALAPRIQLETGTPRATMAAPLRALGHDVVVEATRSGAGFIQRVPGGWLGAADPRRDGVALGQ